MEFRNATLEERKQFYENEFNPGKAVDMEFKPQLFAIDLGSKTGIAKFPERNGRIIMIYPKNGIKEIHQKCIHFLPENAYYDRNIYTDADEFYAGKKFRNFWEDKNYAGQELCFDIDADNIEEADYRDEKAFTELLKKAALKALQLADKLKSIHGFQKISYVYSGRGFHIKIRNSGSEKLSFRERSALNNSLKEFPIDRWVSGGYSKLMRLPFSLHGLISRIVTPIKESELYDFNPGDEKFIPKFMK